MKDYNRYVTLIILVLASRAYTQQPSGFAIADKADAIVVSDVQSGQQVGYSFALTLDVVRPIKGDLVTGAVINASGACGISVNRDLKGHYGMFFLNKAGGNQWTIRGISQGGAPFEGTYFPLSRTTTPASVSVSSPISTTNDRIAVELAAGLQAHSSALQLYQLARGLIAIPMGPVKQGILQAHRASPDPELKFLALAQLLRANDPSALGEIASGTTLLPQLTVRVFVVDALYGRRDSDATTIGNLGKLSSSSDPEVQRAVADVLMRVHTRDTLPFFAQLLDSADARARELAIGGFSRFVENLPIETQYNALNGKSILPQGPTPYRTGQTDKYSLSTRRLTDSTETEAAFLQFWKSWWAANKAQILPGGK